MDLKKKIITNKQLNKNSVPHLIIKYSDAINDKKLGIRGNNGRKILVNEIYREKECHAQKGLDQKHPDFVIWKSDNKEKTPTIEVGYGGTEVATFTEQTKQERHKHMKGTEFYIVLDGTMKIKIDDKEFELNEKDEAIIFPGTVHETVSGGRKFVTRVHFTDCYGENDKYIKPDGKWKLVKDQE